MAERGWEEVDRLVELKALNYELEEKRGEVVHGLVEERTLDGELE